MLLKYINYKTDLCRNRFQFGDGIKVLLIIIKFYKENMYTVGSFETVQSNARQTGSTKKKHDKINTSFDNASQSWTGAR